MREREREREREKESEKIVIERKREIKTGTYIESVIKSQEREREGLR